MNKDEYFPSMKRRVISCSIVVHFILCALLFFITSCSKKELNEVNIGFIGPLSTRATDLGIGPANAMELAVEQYNNNRQEGEPRVNLYVEDDQWEKDKALPAYLKLRKEHDIKVLFISNTDGTIALQDQIMQDNVVAVNPINNDALLSTMNRNTFKIAKSTEDANALIAIRIIELGLKKVMIMHYPNDFMTRATGAAKALLDQAGIENKVVKTTIGDTDFNSILKSGKREEYDAYVFFGYKEFGYAMKQARDLGIEAPFFGSTTLLDPEFYNNSEGAIIGTECSFFTPVDGNYVLAKEFLDGYEMMFGEQPHSVWPPMQSYDAINLVLNEIKKVNDTKPKNESFGDWLVKKLFKVRYYQGVCGNLSIAEDGSSRGIYFSLYQYDSKGKLVKVRR